MASPERHVQGRENKSIWDSRFFKGGLVAGGLGAVLGIGLVVELGVIGAGIGAGSHYISKKKKV